MHAIQRESSYYNLNLNYNYNWTLCTTRNKLASNIWMGPSQHRLQTDASCRVRCSWNQIEKEGPPEAEPHPRCSRPHMPGSGGATAPSELECSAHKGRGLKESTRGSGAQFFGPRSQPHVRCQAASVTSAPGPLSQTDLNDRPTEKEPKTHG